MQSYIAINFIYLYNINFAFFGTLIGFLLLKVRQKYANTENFKSNTHIRFYIENQGKTYHSIGFNDATTRHFIAHFA